MALATFDPPAYGSPLAYERHIPAINALLTSLPAETRPWGTPFAGGFMLHCSDTHYVAVLLPPCTVAHENLGAYLGEHFDGEWEIVGYEYRGQVEAVHMMAPWA